MTIFQQFRDWCKRLINRKSRRLPRVSSLRVDIAHNPPILVVLDPESDARQNKAFGPERLSPETMRQLLLSIDHTSSSVN